MDDPLANLPPDLQVIDRPDLADAALWALRALAKREAEVVELANLRHSQIVEWRVDELLPIETVRERLVRLLEGYHTAILRQDPKRKTIKLPGGSLKARTTRVDGLRIQDRKELLAFAKESLPEALTTTVDVDVAKVKELLTVVDGVPVTADGVVVRGLEVVPAGSTSYDYELGSDSADEEA